MNNTYTSQEDIAIARELLSCPGDTLAEHLDYIGITKMELAKQLQCSEQTINEIIKGTAPITTAIALQLEQCIGIPANFWIERDRQYWLQLAEINEAENRLALSNKALQLNIPLIMKKRTSCSCN
uniref:Putative plasmid maintenance system antidote protein, XRE family n=1 Tax=Chlorobium chlorochromatii (strain CaD3) TaxID=340177 RepID=Q3AU13_CHLCH